MIPGRGVIPNRESVCDVGQRVHQRDPADLHFDFVKKPFPYPIGVWPPHLDRPQQVTTPGPVERFGRRGVPRTPHRFEAEPIDDRMFVILDPPP